MQQISTQVMQTDKILPKELWSQILCFVKGKINMNDILTMAKVNTHFKTILMD